MFISKKQHQIALFGKPEDAVVKALAFHQYGSVGVRGWVCCRFLLCSESFLRVLRFSSLHKNSTRKEDPYKADVASSQKGKAGY